MADDDHKQITDQLAAACKDNRCMGRAAIEDMLTRLALQPDAGLAKREDDEIVLYVIAEGLLFEVRSDCKSRSNIGHPPETVVCCLRSVPASDDASVEYRTELTERNDDERELVTTKAQLRFALGECKVEVAGVPDDPKAADHFARSLLVQVFAPRTRRATGKVTAA